MLQDQLELLVSHVTGLLLDLEPRQLLCVVFASGAVSALVINYVIERLWSALASRYRPFDRRGHW